MPCFLAMFDAGGELDFISQAWSITSHKAFSLLIFVEKNVLLLASFQLFNFSIRGVGIWAGWLKCFFWGQFLFTPP